VLAVELARIIVGDSLDFSVSVPGYPASEGWTLKYRLIPRTSGSAITFVSTADGDLHIVAVSAATTALWVAGPYNWAAYVEHTDLRSVTWQTGAITLAPNPRTSTAPLDLRSEAEIALAAAESAMASWTPTTRSYTIGGRSMTFSSAAEIRPILDYWKAKVQRERRAARLAAGLPDPRKHLVRLGNV
jgi:hypothetical protein